MTQIDFLQSVAQLVKKKLSEKKPEQKLIQSCETTEEKQSFMENQLKYFKPSPNFTSNILDSIIEAQTQEILLKHVAEAQQGLVSTNGCIESNMIALNDELLSEQQIINICLHLHPNFDYSKLYDWQKELLAKTFLKQSILRNNLLIQAGTASGKTFIVQLFILRCLLQFKKSVIFVVPFVTLVDELTLVFKEILNTACSLCCLSGMKQLPQFISVKPTLYLCTIEKANLLVREVIKQSLLEKFGLIICDEIHVSAENGSERASRYELLLSQLLIIQEKFSYKIISMSATIDNVDDFKNWMRADLVSSSYRPVTLKNYVVVGNEMASINLKEQDQKLELQPINSQIDFQTSNLMLLAIQTIKPLIIFCPTRAKTRQVSNDLANIIKLRFNQKQDYLKLQQRQLLLSQLVTKINDVLYGVCYHNASLPQADRQLIETAYKDGVLHTLVATTTVASGVNLPAVSIVISSTKVGIQDLDNNRYRQMIGRAGRISSVKQGFTYLIYEGKQDVNQFLAEFLKPQLSLSQLMAPEYVTNSVNQLLLFCYQFQVQDFNQALQRTLFFVQNPQTQSSYRQNVEFLIKLAVLQSLPNGSIKLTNIGRAVGDSGVTVIAGFIFSQLLDRIALRGFQLCNDQQLALLVSFAFGRFHNAAIDDSKLELRELLECEQELGQIEYFELTNLDPFVVGFLDINNQEMEQLISSNKTVNKAKYYVAFDVVKLQRAVRRFRDKQVSQDDEEAIKNAASQAGQLSIFARSMEVEQLSVLLKQYQQGLRQLLLDDLGDLLEIRYVGAARARLLTQSGFHSAEDIVKNGYDQFRLLVQFGDMTDAASRLVFDGAVELLERQRLAQ